MKTTMYTSQMIGLLSVESDGLDYSRYALEASDDQLESIADLVDVDGSDEPVQLTYRPHVAFAILHKVQKINEIIHSSLPSVFPTPDTFKVLALNFSLDFFTNPNSAKLEVNYNHDEICHRFETSDELLNVTWETIKDAFTQSSGYNPYVKIESAEQLSILFGRNYKHVATTVLSYIVSALIYAEYEDESYNYDNRDFDSEGLEGDLNEEATTGSCRITSDQVTELLNVKY